VPYVMCPSCQKISHTAASRGGPALCPRCGELLPARRTVVSISRYRRLVDGDAVERRERAEALEAA
jgi:hypothetical protein